MGVGRVGNFSSSEIYKLTKLNRKGDDFGQVALTYIKEKAMEKKLGRSLRPFTFSKPTSWGTFVESIAFDEMGLEADLVSDKRLYHPEIDNWTGVPDYVGKVVGDIKCPWTLDSFCNMYEMEDLKSDKPEYYWQLVSNSILTGIDTAELAIYCPYQGDLKRIRQEASNSEEHSWIAYSQDLPYLIFGNFYNSIKKHTFEVPKEDKDFLTEQVKKANEILTGLI